MSAINVVVHDIVIRKSLYRRQICLLSRKSVIGMNLVFRRELLGGCRSVAISDDVHYGRGKAANNAVYQFGGGSGSRWGYAYTDDLIGYAYTVDLIY